MYLFPGSLLGYFFYGDLSAQPQLTPEYIISTNHLLAFFILSTIGFFSYKKSSYFNFLIIYLIFISIILEIMHFIIPERSFELSDLFGNIVGVLIVVIIDYFLKKYENF